MFKIYFDHTEYDQGLKIIIMDERADGKRYIAKNVEFVFKEFKQGDLPTLKIGYPMAEPFLKAFAECLDKHGIKTENDFKIRGLLEATKYHLEDMRNIVFKK